MNHSSNNLPDDKEILIGVIFTLIGIPLFCGLLITIGKFLI